LELNARGSCGADGLDEVTIADKTFVAEARRGEVRRFEITPEDFGFERTALDGLNSGDAEVNAGVVRGVLSGERRDAARALVIVNAAAALRVGGVASDLSEARQLAESSIDSGEAQQKLDQLVRATN
jgi:anthranilate phosphoribosyltransferase